MNNYYNEIVEAAKKFDFTIIEGLTHIVTINGVDYVAFRATNIYTKHNHITIYGDDFDGIKALIIEDKATKSNLVETIKQNEIKTILSPLFDI